MADETYGIVINVQSNKAKRELQAIDEKLADLQDKKTVFIQAKTELTKQLAEIEKLDSQLDDLKKKKVKIQLDIDNAWKEKLEEVEKAKDRIAKNTNRLVELQPVIDEIKELDSAIERYKKNIKELQSNLKLGNTSNGESLDVQKELLRLNQGKKLELESKRLSPEYKEALSEYNELKKFIQNDNKILLNADEPTQQIKNLNKELDKTVQKEEELTGKKAKITVDIGGVEEGNEKLKNLDENEREINGRIIEQTFKANGIKTFIDNLKELKQQTGNASKALIDFGNSSISLGSTMMQLGKGMQTFFTDNGNSPIGKVAHFLTQGLAFGSMYRLMSDGMNAVSESVSGAIERYDQLNVSIRTLNNLGIATDKVKKSQQELSDSIEGLPTQLNDALSIVTKFTSINHDIDRSTKLFEAMNNGILAFGGSDEDVKNATLQYSQIMGSKMDAMTLRSFENSNFTPVLNAIAKKMGMSFSDFRKNFTGSNPTISLQQFEDALIDLNENGGGGMQASLQTMAKESTQTITNAIKLIKTRMVRGGTEIVSAFNEVTKDITGKSIYENLDDATTSMVKKIEQLGDVIRAHKDDIKNFFEGAKKYAKDAFEGFDKEIDFKKLLPAMLNAGKNVLTTYIKLAQVYVKAMKTLFKVIGGGSWEKGLSRYVQFQAIGGALLQIVGKGILLFGKFNKLIGLTIGKFSNLKAVLKAYSMTKKQFTGTNSAIVEFLKNIKNAIVQTGIYQKTIGKLSGSVKTLKGNLPKKETTVETGEPTVGETPKATLSQGMLNTLAGSASILMMSGSALLAVKALKELDSEIGKKDWLANLGKKILVLGTTMGTLTLLTGAIGKVSELVGYQNVLAGAGAMMMSGGALWIYAKGIGELDDAIPDNVSKFEKKIGSLHKVIASMSLWVGGLGALTGLTGVGALVAGSGVATLVGEAGALYTLSKAIGKLDKEVPKNSKGLSEKLKSLKVVCETIMDMATSNSFQGNNATTMQNVGNAVDSVADAGLKISKLGKIKARTFESAKANVRKVVDVMETIQGANFGSWISSKDKSSSLGEAVSTVSSIVSISKKLNTLGKLKIPDSNNIGSKIGAITKSLQYMNGSKLFTTIKQFGQNTGEVAYGSASSSMVANIVKIAKSFNQLEGIDFNVADVTTKTEDVRTVLSKLKGLKLKGIGVSADKVKSIADAFSQFPNLMNQVNAFSNAMNGVTLNTTDLSTKLGTIASIFDIFKEKDFKKKLKGMPSIDAFTNASNVISQLPNILTSINDFDTKYNEINGQFQGQNMVESIKKSIGGLGDILGAFTEGGKKKDFSSKMKRISEMAEGAQQLPTIISSLTSALDQLKTFNDNMSGIDDTTVSSITGSIGKLRAIISVFSAKTDDSGNKTSSMESIVGKLEKYASAFQSLPTIINSLSSTVNEIQNLNSLLEGVDNNTISTNITNFRDNVLKLFAGNGKNDDDLGSIIHSVKGVDYSALLSSIQTFSSAVNVINALPQVDNASIKAKIDAVGTAFTELKTMAESHSGDKKSAEGLKAVADAYKQSIQAVFDSIDSLTQIGTNMALKISQGFQQYNLGSDLTTALENAVNSAQTNSSSTFLSAGKKLGSTLMKGIKSKISGGSIANKLVSGLTSDKALGALSSAGSLMGKTLRSSIKSHLKNIKVTYTLKEKKSKQHDATGGMIKQRNEGAFINPEFIGNGQVAYKSSGGDILTPKAVGTDTVPAMLTPGEFVIRKSVVDKYGASFMRRLNNGDLESAIKSLTSSRGSLTNMNKYVNITNNSTVNNYDNRSISINNKRGDASTRMKAGRWLRAI